MKIAYSVSPFGAVEAVPCDHDATLALLRASDPLVSAVSSSEITASELTPAVLQALAEAFKLGRVHEIGVQKI